MWTTIAKEVEQLCARKTSMALGQVPLTLALALPLTLALALALALTRALTLTLSPKP